MHPDGTALHELTQPTNGDLSMGPVWSPDSTRIVFSSYHPEINGGQEDLWTINADRSDLSRLTSPLSGYAAGEESPVWGPRPRRPRCAHASRSPRHRRSVDTQRGRGGHPAVTAATPDGALSARDSAGNDIRAAASIPTTAAHGNSPSKPLDATGWAPYGASRANVDRLTVKDGMPRIYSADALTYQPGLLVRSRPYRQGTCEAYALVTTAPRPPDER